MENYRKKEIFNNIAKIERSINLGLLNDNSKEFDDIEIIIASKHQSIDDMIYAKELIKKKSVFGENIAQELRNKYLPSEVWDFIGNIQTNKIKYLVGKTRLIQSVYTTEACDEIQRLCEIKNISQNILLQINAGKEYNKGGVSIDSAVTFLEFIKQYDRIINNGLMIVTPLEYNQAIIKDYFISCKKLYDSIKLYFPSIKYLSMGMSNDYTLAILNGSNMVRLGRAIFGEKK